jgi:hypothetical protein
VTIGIVMAQNVRLALAILDPADRFWAAIPDLVQSGLSSTQIGVAAMPTTMTQIFARPFCIDAARRRIAPLIRRVKQAKVAPCCPPILVTSGPLSEAFGETAPRTTNLAGRWLPSEMRSNLVERIHDGNVLVCVDSRTPVQQRTSSQIFLRHSRYRVETYDFVD